MSDRHHDAALRARFAQRTEPIPDAAACPTAEKLFDAAREQLLPSENEAIALHLVDCAPCTAAWRMLREGVAPAERVVPFAARRPRWIGWSGALAAGLGLIVIGWSLRPNATIDEDGTALRTASNAPIVAATTAPGSCRRDSCRLSWTATPAADHYRLIVTNDDLSPIVTLEDLTGSAATLDATQLQQLRGNRLLWRVEASWQGGQRTSSETFVTSID